MNSYISNQNLFSLVDNLIEIISGTDMLINITFNLTDAIIKSKSSTKLINRCYIIINTLHYIDKKNIASPIGKILIKTLADSIIWSKKYDKKWKINKIIYHKKYDHKFAEYNDNLSWYISDMAHFIQIIKN